MKYEVAISEKCESFRVAEERNFVEENPSLVDPHGSYH
jgi:hypothetical protein